MSIDAVVRGGLFARDFLHEPDSIGELAEWKALSDSVLDTVEEKLGALLREFPTSGTPNESETEDDLIWPTLRCLGWGSFLRQQNLSGSGRTDVPDGLLFENSAAKRRAVRLEEETARYGVGVALVESKRWRRPLDTAGDAWTAPSTQMLRYLRRADDLTSGRLRWGILTNGTQWRLYHQGARSVSEDFLAVNLAALVSPSERGHSGLEQHERRHCLKLFLLLFRPQAFSRGPDGQSLHARALSESRRYEERVAEDISNLVFDEVFPQLVTAVAKGAPDDAPLSEVRDAALVLLYRTLFLLYAEDRSLLPVHDEGYASVGLCQRVREDVGARRDRGESFSTKTRRYYSAIEDLCRLIDQGERKFGLPPYNGGLFDESKTPLLRQVRLPDSVMADVVDALSFRKLEHQRRYINYRSFSVQQLGSLYERLLEFEVVREGSGVVVRPNVFARKDAGGYYTPESLVALVLEETVGPLVDARLDAFREQVAAAGNGDSAGSVAEIARFDAAEAILSLRVCDPAMGSGHFLVSLVDFLSDRVIEALAEADAIEGYVSPVAARIAGIRRTISERAETEGWIVDSSHLDDRQIVRRMVLKRCVHGVDKNPMAVELAKVSLWLHTFTVGAPLSFLDHHLRCGDSLFGCWVDEGVKKAEARGGGGMLFLQDPIGRAKAAANPMYMIEALSDAEIAEAEQSSVLFESVRKETEPLRAFLSVLHALDWLEPDADGRERIAAWLTGILGDPVAIAAGADLATPEVPGSDSVLELLSRARELAAEERFLHWQVAFPSVWSDWESPDRKGGFDAVVGNPPWDRMKLQQVEWFALRRPDIAMAPRAADRRRMMRELEETGDPLAEDFRRASERASMAIRTAQQGGQYPLLSHGDINLYALFVERALALVNPDGLVGLLTPSGIASDRNAARFFGAVATEGRLRALYDFENRRTRFDTEQRKAAPFFRHVDSRFKFCVFVVGRSPSGTAAKCAFFLQDVSEVGDPDRCFPLDVADFAKVNPNTKTAPIFRSRRDAQLTTSIYGRVPVLADRSDTTVVQSWPVRYKRMLDMTNDSHLFRARRELEEEEGAWAVAGNRLESQSSLWLPLYEGKMVQAFDHRAASVVVNPENRYRPAQPAPATLDQHEDPNWAPEPQYWVDAAICGSAEWRLAFKDVTSPTNVRSVIAALIPAAGCGNSLPVMEAEVGHRPEWFFAANMNSTVFDYVARQKIQGQHLNLFLMEQLPVISEDVAVTTAFGAKTAMEIVREAVLELTYTAHDMVPFARDVGHIDRKGKAKPPFEWNPERRLRLRAKLDAVFFHLYGVTARKDVHHIYSTFTIVECQEVAAYGRYRTRDLCLAWINALAAGKPDAEPDA